MNKEDLGEIIRQRRKYLGVTQKDLSEIVGIGLRSLINIESGKGNPTIETLFSVSEALGLTFEIKVESQGMKNAKI